MGLTEGASVHTGFCLYATGPGEFTADSLPPRRGRPRAAHSALTHPAGSGSGLWFTTRRRLWPLKLHQGESCFATIFTPRLAQSVLKVGTEDHHVAFHVACRHGHFSGPAALEKQDFPVLGSLFLFSQWTHPPL